MREERVERMEMVSRNETVEMSVRSRMKRLTKKARQVSKKITISRELHKFSHKSKSASHNGSFQRFECNFHFAIESICILQSMLWLLHYFSDTFPTDFGTRREGNKKITRSILQILFFHCNGFYFNDVIQRRNKIQFYFPRRFFSVKLNENEVK
jgi:hypothetical protein